MLFGLGVVAVFFGLVYKMFPPKNVNYFYGHKTKLAMKNEDTWQEANRFSALSMMLTGLLMMASGYVCYGPLRLNDTQNRPVIVALVIVLMVAMVTANEMNLRRKFDMNGKRKSSV